VSSVLEVQPPPHETHVGGLDYCLPPPPNILRVVQIARRRCCFRYLGFRKHIIAPHPAPAAPAAPALAELKREKGGSKALLG